MGNVMLIGFPDQWIRILGERIKAVHFKDFKLSIHFWRQPAAAWMPSWPWRRSDDA